MKLETYHGKDTEIESAKFVGREKYHRSGCRSDEQKEAQQFRRNYGGEIVILNQLWGGRDRGEEEE